jgi:hypothetical protein
VGDRALFSSVLAEAHQVAATHPRLSDLAEAKMSLARGAWTLGLFSTALDLASGSLDAALIRGEARVAAEAEVILRAVRARCCSPELRPERADVDEEVLRFAGQVVNDFSTA